MRLSLKRRGLACREIVEMVTAYFDGSLPRAERRRFDEHLAGCEHCTEYLRQMRETIRLTGTLREDDLSEDMRQEFGELFRRVREED